MAGKKQPPNTVLELGQLAKAKLYQTIVSKISGGESLTAAEIRFMAEYEKQAEAGDDENSTVPDLFPSMDAAAQYAGVSKTTIHYHAKRGRIAVNPDGSIPRESVDAWRSSRGGGGRGGDRRKKKRNQAGGDAVPVGVEKELADLRWRLAKAEREEMLVAQLKGTLASWDQIEKEWASRVGVVTAGLSALADRLPPLLEGKTRAEMAKVLRDEVWQLRDAYARKGKYCPLAKS